MDRTSDHELCVEVTDSAKFDENIRKSGLFHITQMSQIRAWCCLF